METLIKLHNSTAGRDKQARLLQYLSRFVWYNLQKSSRADVEKLKSLEYQLSTFRKLLRFGRFFESLYAALPLFHEHDPTIRYALTLGKVANSLFLLADHVLWLGRADLCAVDTEKWARISNKYWLYSIAMNLMRDLYEISKIVRASKEQTGGMASAVVRIVRGNPHVFVDTVKNGCDFFIPLTALGHVKLSPGTIGMLGVVSSIAGMLVLIDPAKKMVPA